MIKRFTIQHRAKLESIERRAPKMRDHLPLNLPKPIPILDVEVKDLNATVNSKLTLEDLINSARQQRVIFND